MFGYSQIARHVRQWRADRKRIAIESMIYKLPIELQKDIGWPATRAQSPTTRTRSDLQARPIL